MDCRSVLACLVIVVMSLGPGAGCSDAGRGRAPAAGVELRSGGTVVIAGPQDLERPNPLVASDRWTREVNRFLLYMPLVQLDGRSGYEPYLAESWELHGDTAIVFRLHRDVRWHDGVPTTAHDAAFTFQRAMEPATAFPNTDFVASWTAVEAIDSFTLRLRFRPHADPLASLPYLPVAPRHLLDTVPPDRLRTSEFNRSPVGNGPFRFVAQAPNDRWVFDANPDFPAALGGRPAVDRIVWRVVPEPSARITELLTGRAHLITSPPAERLDELDARPGIQAHLRPGALYAVVAWNGRRPPLDDARVRRALTLAIDRAALVNGLRAGHGEVAAGPIGPTHWAFDPALRPLPHDPDAARALLAEAGFVDRDGDGRIQDAAGQPLVIPLDFAAQSALQRDAAQMIQQDLAAVGVSVAARPLEFATLVRGISAPEKSFHAVFMAFETEHRLDLRDLFHSSRIGGPFQLASYANPDADRLMDAAAAARTREEALPLYRQLQSILHDDQPWSFLYHYPELFATTERLRGLSMDARGALVSAHRWWLAGGSIADEP